MDPLRSLMPHFIGIGAMRSGTTWLATQLARHPDIRIGRKEMHFFDRKLGPLGTPGSARDLLNRARYSACFIRGPREGRIRGEITPAYAILDPAIIARIHLWMPDVKLIYMMRDPVERAWSQARNDFPVWRGKPIQDVGRDELIRFFDSEPVRRRSDYAGCLRNWLSVYSSDQFFFGFMDEIRASPVELIRDVLAFLGTDESVLIDPENARRSVGSAESASMPDWVRGHLENAWSLDAAQLSELIGREVPWAS